MISVCIATFNGEEYIFKQLESIIRQLSQDDEIIVSDDYSNDRTVEIIKSLNDDRIKIIYNETKSKHKWKKNHHHVTSNFENALSLAKGDYILLSDQDDIWAQNKVSTLLELFKTKDLILSDCQIINNNDEIIVNSFFQLKKSRPGILHNLIRPRYHGCCMAFKKKIVDIALPFPKYLIAHDIWIGLVAECFFSVKFSEEKLVFYRIHNNNVSDNLSKSPNSFYYKIKYRLYIGIHLIFRYLKFSTKKINFQKIF